MTWGSCPDRFRFNRHQAGAPFKAPSRPRPRQTFWEAREGTGPSRRTWPSRRTEPSRRTGPSHLTGPSRRTGPSHLTGPSRRMGPSLRTEPIRTGPSLAGVTRRERSREAGGGEVGDAHARMRSRSLGLTGWRGSPPLPVCSIGRRGASPRGLRFNAHGPSGCRAVSALPGGLPYRRLGFARRGYGWFESPGAGRVGGGRIVVAACIDWVRMTFWRARAPAAWRLWPARLPRRLNAYESRAVGSAEAVLVGPIESTLWFVGRVLARLARARCRPLPERGAERRRWCRA